MSKRGVPVLLCCILIQGAAAAAPGQEAGPGESPEAPLPPVPETVWPPPYAPLKVLILPQGGARTSVAAESVPGWSRVVFEDAAFGSVLDVLSRHFEPRDDWRPSELFAEVLRFLRPPLPHPDAVVATVEPPDLGTVLGGRFFGLDLPRIYVSYGLREDGSKPEPAGFGIYSPLSPVYCLGPGNSCAIPLLSGEDPRVPKGDTP